MAWNGNNDSVLPNSSKNYMFGDKVFILDEITEDNCAYLIGDLTNFILTPENNGKRLMFVINSPGGSVYTMLTIIGLINLAKLNNITVYTFVMGMASSAASIIAVQGDQRFITNASRHFIHFGSIFDITTKHSEIEKMYLQNKEYADKMIGFYLEACAGKLTKEKLLEIQSDERGYLNAEDCITYGLVDVIIENDLKQKRLEELYQEEFEAGYDDFLKEKKKALKASMKKKKKEVETDDK